MSHIRKNDNERGITLVELMISLLLFSILATGTFMALSSQQQSSRKQSMTTGLLDSARSTLNALSMQLAGIKSGMPFGVAALNNVANLPTGVTQCPNLYGTRPFGMDPAIVAPAGTLVPVIEVTNTLGGPDKMRIISPTGSAWGGLTVEVTPGLTQVDFYTTNGSLPPLSNDDWAMVTDYNNAVLFKLSSDPTNAGCTTPAPTVCMGKTAGTYTEPATIAVGRTMLGVRWQLFHVGMFLGRDSLLVDDVTGTSEPTAIDIEDMQIALGIDGADGSVPDGIIGVENNTGVGLDEWVFNVSGETIPVDICNLGNLRAIRITIVARSSVELEGAKLVVPRIEDRAARGPDGFYRVILSTTVAVRQ
ncbi:MAG: prepilin-type N-terminal cleavage/methylation domain-containing protein [Deltaproteobacteria bacterium]|nr:prepilin-type N-terminal cleavage/methylation domain-containing protein [Deltaproteobacteria bacterium]